MAICVAVAPGADRSIQPKASGRAAFHEVALPVGGCPAFGAVGDDERVRIDEKASSRGAKGLSPGLSDRFARVRSFEDQDAAPVETNREAIRRTGGDKGHSLFERAGVARSKRASLRREPQDLRAARTEKRAAVLREIVDVRERQGDGRGVKQRVWPKRAVHHRRRSGFVVEAAKSRIGALEGGDHCASPQ